MLNKFIAMGRLTAHPELKTTTSGTSVTSFTLAVDRNYTAKGDTRKTDFIKCVAWRNTAEFISKYFKKGKLMAIEGELQSRDYEDRDGNKRTAWEVIVSNAYFGGDKSESSNDEDDKPWTHPEGAVEIVVDEELPF